MQQYNNDIEREKWGFGKRGCAKNLASFSVYFCLLAPYSAHVCEPESLRGWLGYGVFAGEIVLIPPNTNTKLFGTKRMVKTARGGNIKPLSSLCFQQNLSQANHPPPSRRCTSHEFPACDLFVADVSVPFLCPWCLRLKGFFAHTHVILNPFFRFAYALFFPLTWLWFSPEISAG